MLARIAKLLLIQQPLPGPGLLFASGLVKPVDGTKGYRTGCFFQHTDGGTNTSCYINEGSVTSCSFQAVAASTSETLDDCADVDPTDYTAGSILVADGSKWVEVAVSGQATLAATGALTIPLLSATLGVVAASKAVLVDGSKDVSAFRTVGCVNLDCGSAAGAGVGGTLDIYSATTAKGRMHLEYVDGAADNSLLITNDTISGSDKTATFTNTTGKVVLSTAALTCAEVDVLDAVSPGTAASSKAVVLGSSGEIATITTLTATTINNTTLNSTSIDAGSAAGGTAGSVDIFPVTAAAGKLTVTSGGSTGDFKITLTTALNDTSAKTVTIPALTGYVALATGSLSLAEVDVLDAVTPGTAAVSKAVVLNSAGHIDTLKMTALWIGASGSATQVTASAAELNVLASATAGDAVASKALIVDAYKAARLGAFAGGGDSTGAVIMAATLNKYTDGQLDVLSVFGASTSDLTNSYSAKCARFRHIVTGTGLTVNHETYGAIGQLVVKGTTLGHLHAGLMGTLEGHTSGAVANGAYEHGIGAIIARVGGGAAIAATKSVSGVIAFWNGAALGTAGAGSNAFATCDTGDGLWTTGLAISRATNAFAFPASGTAPVAAGAYAVGGGTMVRISVLVGGAQYYMLASTEPKADAIE